MDELFKLDAFEEWVQEQRDEVFIGRAGNPRMCPLARYLTQRTGIDFTVARGVCWESSLMDEEGYERFESWHMPRWAYWFEVWVDGGFGVGIWVPRGETLYALSMLRQGKVYNAFTRLWVEQEA